MKALVPFNNLINYEGYKKSGAGEFYIGFYDPQWHRVFGDFADLNRLTGYKESANANTFEEVLAIIKVVKQDNLAIYVTFNSSIYSEEQLIFMERYMEPLYEAGADGIIVSCPELIEVAKKYHLNAVISTIAGVYNKDIANYYRKLGAARIILPRDLSMEDIEQIATGIPDMEYEVFMMRNGCIYSDSQCLGLHRNEKSAICAALRDAACSLTNLKGDFQSWHDLELNHMVYQKNFHSFACGLCSIYRFVRMGITAGKIVGRTDNYEEVCEDIRLICENVAIARSCSSEKEYLEKMQFPTKTTIMCKMGMNCYYPEVRF